MSAGRHLQVRWIDDFLIAVDAVAVCLVLALLAGMRPRLRLTLLIVVTLPVWVVVCAHVSDRWHQEVVPCYARMPPFKGLSDIERLKRGPQTILVLQPRCYPFFGPRRQHRVCQPVYVPSAGWIMEFIEAEGVAFVAADLGMRPDSIGHRRFLGFDECLARHPNRFRAVNEDQKTLFADRKILFEVLPPTAETRKAAEDRQ
jgi:hypothetical protein